jgi:hypothetical protein
MYYDHRHLFHSKNICPLLFLSKEDEGAYIFWMKQVPVITTQCSTEINTYSRLKIINSFQSSLNMLNLKCICDYILLYIVLIYVGWNLCTYVSSEYVNLHRCFVCTCSHIHVRRVAAFTQKINCLHIISAKK